MGQTEVFEIMANPLGSDEGVENEATKGNFVARVSQSEVESDEYGMKEEYKEEDESYFEHLYELEVLSEDWGNLHEFSITVNNNFNSKWMLLIGHLESIHGNLKEQGVESLTDLAEFLEDRVYEFREIGFTEDEEFSYPNADKTVNFSKMFSGGENAPNNFIVPVREITDEDKLADLGQEPGADSDEVDAVEL